MTKDGAPRARPRHAVDRRAQAEDLMVNVGHLLEQAGKLFADAEGGDPASISSERDPPSIRPGMQVADRAGESLGQVMTVRVDFIVVESGTLLPTDYYVPHAAIAVVEGEMVRLRVDKAHTQRMVWDHGWIDGSQTSGEFA